MTVGSFDASRQTPLTQARPAAGAATAPKPSETAKPTTPVSATDDLQFSSALNLPEPKRAITSKLQVKIEQRRPG